MRMSPAVRRSALTVHVTVSVGWLGAVAAFLVVAVAGARSADGQRAAAAYLAAELITWWLIVPLCLASLASGVVQSVGTSWGLLRHYWVVIKLGLTVVATVLLLLHTRPIGVLAAAAADGSVLTPPMAGLRTQLVFDAAAAVLVLLVATVLAVVKPRGVTGFGTGRRAAGSPRSARRG